MIKNEKSLFENSDCTVISSDSIIKIKENKCEYIGINATRQKIGIIHVDGCLLYDGKKCDYLLLNYHVKKAIFLELKGQDMTSAVEQILDTIGRLHGLLNAYSIFARVILYRISIPDIRNNPLMVTILRITRRNNGNFKYGKRKFEENI